MLTILEKGYKTSTNKGLTKKEQVLTLIFVLLICLFIQTIISNFMKIKQLVISLVFLSLFSCKNKTNKQFEKDIIGEWIFVKTEDNRIPDSQIKFPLVLPFRTDANGYVFFQDNNCEKKLGYFNRTQGIEIEGRKTFYLGTKTKYKIENDSLKVFDLSNKSWDNKKIHSILDDTLTIQIGDSLVAKYARTKHKIISNESYDKILVSSSGCFGTCPILDISIDKNGDVLYFGELYNTQNGLFSSKITKEEYQSIETSFKKADILNLKNEYKAHWTDDEAITITFIKDHKIVKSIMDYGRQAPTELIWAYTPVRFLYQQIKLEPLKTENLILSSREINFETQQQICNLTQSESFYLLTEIFKGKEVLQNFDNKYKIEFWNDKNKQDIMLTDGRLFKFPNKTIDIGYNFLIQNNLASKFRNKNEYGR